MTAKDKPWEIFAGDGASGLFEYGEVDFVFADVPFGKHVEEGNEAETLRGNHFDFEAMTPELMQRLSQSIAARCRRWAVIKTSEEETHLWRAAMELAGMDYIRTGQWVKLNPKPQITGDRPAQGCEPLLIFHSRIGTMHWNGGGKAAVWHAPVIRGDAKLHPTHTPPQLLKQLVEDFTDPGELCADPCFGSCETGVVALGLGRRFVGWEINPYYVDLAPERMSSPLLDNRPMQVNAFAPSTSSRAANARAALDRDLLRLVNATDPTVGIGKTDLAGLISATPAELSSSLNRLRKKHLIRREGKTNDSKYFRVSQNVEQTQVSTGDSQ